jgi:hypothetical protein
MHMNMQPSTAFAYVVDGEVGHVHFMANTILNAIAIMSSDPKVVVIPEEIVDEISKNAGLGWKYLDGKFISPTENV